jgi:tRNA pseudouridine38-40 synthase
MAELARALVGRMDFGAFGQAPIPGGHTVRQVTQAGWTLQADELTFAIEADAFLKHMVRRLVAANLAVGQGQIEPKAVIDLLDHPELRWEGRMADPQGLSLIAVTYDGRGTRASDDD